MAGEVIKQFFVSFLPFFGFYCFSGVPVGAGFIEEIVDDVY
ncbi:hypothetical protein QQO25_12390 [Corynebacterium lehmanniae]|nr:hypothetical protein [Corynebacterium lehmanniae]